MSGFSPVSRRALRSSGDTRAILRLRRKRRRRIHFHDPSLLLEARHDPVDGLVEVRHLYRRLALPGGQQGRFVHEIGQVGSDEPRGSSSNGRQVDGGREGDLSDLRVGLELGIGYLGLSFAARPRTCEPPGLTSSASAATRP
jgi:hypothetical protein